MITDFIIHGQHSSFYPYMPNRLVRLPRPDTLPPILAGQSTPQVTERVNQFYASIAEIFEAWIARRKSPHTKRAYRQDVLSLVKFLKIRWPEESVRLLAVSIKDVQDFRDEMLSRDAAPKTLNRRIASVSSFYKFMGAAASELRLPITVPNPAHAQFIAHESTDPREETRALSATRARQLMGMPSGDTVIDYRDRAILKLYVYSAIRLATGCRLKISDFHQEGDTATIRLHEKGDKHRTIGLHYTAAQAITEYIQAAGLTSGPLFRARLNSRSNKLSKRPIGSTTMYRLIEHYLQRLPGSIKESVHADGTTTRQCIYTPHSLRATTATLLLDASVDIVKVQDLLGHRHVTTTQIYDKRRRSTNESASHEVPI
jgi:integrase/recombinase XerD